MSKILSYNNKTTGEGWIVLNSQYNADDIEMISDPNGGLSSRPRTAIPSPLAQMDLVKNAFKRLAASPALRGEAMDEKLVANAFDVAQLFFNFGELRNQMRIVAWDRKAGIDALKSSPSHRLLGETLEMYFTQDREAFNFDKLDRLYFLIWRDKVLGCTSPVTLFMATPNAKEGDFDLPVEQNVRLFQTWRPLYKRDAKFVKYIYALFTAYPQLKKHCGELNAYLIACFPLLSQELQNAILTEVGNPAAFDEESAERAKTLLQTTFSQMAEGVQALGIPFYEARLTDIEAAIAQSDFMLVPSRPQEKDERIPLVLQNNLNTTPSDPFNYITGAWQNTTVITPADYQLPPEKRKLPATNHEYPWLTDDDFLQPSLIKLDYALDRDCFFNGNITKTTREADDCDFLLPLKPLFFKYFDVKDLWGTINGQPRFEMQHARNGAMESVTAILRLPVRKRGACITLKRTYVAANNLDLTFDAKNNCGHFISVPFAMSVFPFVRVTSAPLYDVQLVDRALGPLENYRLSLEFYQNGFQNRVEPDDVNARERSLKQEKRVGSTYYQLSANFDYATVVLTDDRNALAAEGVVCPRWNETGTGHEQFTFAVDFGTTNTHLEYMTTTELPKPLHLDSLSRDRLLATLYNGPKILYDVILKQEFLPKEIGGEYGFPQRTVLSESERLDAENVDQIVALCDANIPFIYEKESIGYGNRIVPNLKWSTETSNSKRIYAYLTELALLMRTNVLLEKGDLNKTRLVWFYPLAMKIGNVRKLSEMWAKIFKRVFGTTPTEQNLIQMPESVAPYYFYKCSSQFRGAASTVASIDIGGGSSDVVVFEPNEKQPTMLTSFRFAANVLFGDGFSEVPHGDTNPMLVKYVDYFRRLFDADDEKYGELSGILENITSRRKSEDINAFLFSVVNNRVVGANDVFSYNMRLNEDGQFKIVFIYFYVALVFYVAKMMKHRGVNKPRSLMFSGTGSKVLDIVGAQRELNLLTQMVFERVYGETYDADGFSVIMERNEPKQITCRGALMQVRDDIGCASVAELNRMIDDFNQTLKGNYSMISREKLIYSDMDDLSVRQELITRVKEFNDFFISLCDEIHVANRFLVDNSALLHLKETVNKDLEHHLINGWNFTNKNEVDRNKSDVVEDTVFFYPIIGSIRENLIGG